MAPKENKQPKPIKAPNPKLRNFLFKLVLASETNPNLAQIIIWTKKEEMVFQLVDREEVARRWSAHKGTNREMNYESMSRSLRAYYRAGIMEKVAGKNFRYQFLPDNWIRAQLAQANAKKNNFSIDKILGPQTTQ
ncbi:hypothetical protein L5515_012615 [Caenorhabditis briggsae]|uniref:ETS domain-containing protein n=1 Tax=Caenorhabditis briggsae TaxID=6238 RepID=A0AAE9JHC0_CAEBR|nr:hypothetical protein L5515_012615 [Caenorhabditis briggsae]